MEKNHAFHKSKRSYGRAAGNDLGSVRGRRGCPSNCREQVSGIIVVDDRGAVVGMLSELDCLRSLLAEVYNQGQVGAAPVTSVMTTPVTTTAPDGDIITVAESMLSQQQRRRPVVKDGKLKGQATCRQLLTTILSLGPIRRSSIAPWFYERSRTSRLGTFLICHAWQGKLYGGVQSCKGISSMTIIVNFLSAG